MLTRKQQWRRVKDQCKPRPQVPAGDGGAGGSASSPPSCGGRKQRPPLDALNLGDSLLQLLGAASAPRDYTTSSRSAEDDTAGGDHHARPTANSERQPLPRRRVSFNRQVRVILVPCRTELRVVSPQLWWSSGDYVDFRWGEGFSLSLSLCCFLACLFLGVCVVFGCRRKQKTLAADAAEPAVFFNVPSGEVTIPGEPLRERGSACTRLLASVISLLTYPPPLLLNSENRVDRNRGEPSSEIRSGASFLSPRSKQTCTHLRGAPFYQVALARPPNRILPALRDRILCLPWSVRRGCEKIHYDVVVGWRLGRSGRA